MFSIKKISELGKGKIERLQDTELSDMSLFIDSATPSVPSCFPNCYKADLRGLDMSGQDLFSNFAGADFSPKVSPKGTIKTNLSDADLTGTVLNGAKLNGAILTNARLIGANLYDANLAGADLGAATHDSTTTWPTVEYWDNVTCPDGTNSDETGNATCGFKV